MHDDCLYELGTARSALYGGRFRKQGAAGEICAGWNARIADHLLEAIGDFNACLLANHGLVTVGVDIQSAFNVAEQLELVAKIFICCKSMGEPAILSDDDMQFMVEKLRSYGQPK